MASVSPYDSASQGATSRMRDAEVVVGPGDLASVIANLALCSVESAVVLSVVKSWTGAYHAYLRKIGGSCAVSEASSATPSLDVARGFPRVAAPVTPEFRSGLEPVEVGRRVTPSTAGYCYLSAVPMHRRQLIAGRLGPNPTIRQLAELDSSELLSDERLKQLYIVGRGRSYHMQVVPGENGRSVYDAIRADCELDEEGCNRRVGASGLGEVLCERMGSSEFTRIVGSGQLDSGLKLVTKSAALHGPADKAKLRALEALGDSALTHVLARRCVGNGLSAQQFQSARSACTNNAALSALFVKELPQDMFVFPSGVFPNIGAVGAKTLEAILGVVDYYAGFNYAAILIRSLGILSLAGMPSYDADDTIGSDNYEALQARCEHALRENGVEMTSGLPVVDLRGVDAYSGRVKDVTQGMTVVSRDSVYEGTARFSSYASEDFHFPSRGKVVSWSMQDVLYGSKFALFDASSMRSFEVWNGMEFIKPPAWFVLDQDSVLCIRLQQNLNFMSIALMEKA